MVLNNVHYRSGVIFSLGGLTLSLYSYGIYSMMVEINKLVLIKKERKLTAFELFQLIGFLITTIIGILLIIVYIYYIF